MGEKAARIAQWAALGLTAFLAGGLPFVASNALVGPMTAQMTVLQIAIALPALVAALALVLRGAEALRPNAADVLLLGFFLVASASALLSPAPGASLGYLTILLAFWGSYFLYRLVLADVLSVKAYLGVLAVVGALVALIGLGQLYGLNWGPYATQERRGKNLLVSSLGNANFVGSFLAPLGVLTVGLVLATPRWSLRVAAGVLALVMVAGLFATAARAATGGFLIGLAVAGFLWLPEGRLGRLRGRILAGAGAAAALLVVALGLLAMTAPRLNVLDNLTSTRTIEFRWFHWMVAGEIFAEYPLLGTGPGRVGAEIHPGYGAFFADPDHERFVDVRTRESRTYQHLHNEYLNVLVETGLLGGLCFAGFLVALLVIGWQHAQADAAAGDRPRYILRTAALGALVAAMADMFWGFPTRLPNSALVFAAAAACAVLPPAAARLAGEQNDGEPAPAPAPTPPPAPAPGRLIFPMPAPWRFAAAGLLAVVSLATAAWGWARYQAITQRTYYASVPDMLRADPQHAEVLRAALLRTPDRENPNMVQLTNFYLGGGQAEEARSFLEAMARATNIGPRQYLQLGDARGKTGDWEGAAEAFRLAAVSEPANATTLEYLGFALLRAGRGPEAHAPLEKALELRPCSPNAHYLLGIISAQAGDMEATRRHYEQVLRKLSCYDRALFFDPAKIRQELGP